ncbi:GGDEF domain-containing protein [Photobacterium minamisatsumaniensis]|uniref:GGDEF domain-containing protein n=1 Tax=Photobacterium minamisatsumaniensis TaxID=2910233 RepID=UPI003D128155
MSNDNFAESTETLKKAVPLMIKHKVPTTPTNYALWYTYTSQQMPQLNLALEQGIKELGHCTPTLCDTVYQEHLASETDKDITQLKLSLTAMAQELSHSMIETLSETESFHHVLESTFSKLENINKDGLSIEETIALVKGLIAESRQIRQSTGSFKGQLNSAQQEITTLREALKKSQILVNEDALTGISNRRAFDRDIESYHQSQIPFSLIMLDIDHFKEFNDNFSHILGDQVLKAVARRLVACCQDYAKAYRYGGEEFVVLLPYKSLSSARQQAETMRKTIERISVLDKRSGEKINTITASFGIACHLNNENSRQIIEQADHYLNQAKQLGRNRVLPLNG